MDDLVAQYPRRAHLTNGPDSDFVRSIIDGNFGFDYKDNFRKMMKPVIGIVALHRAELKVNPISIRSLGSALSRLRPERNDHAHKPMHNATNFTTPSVCLSLLEDIFNGLSEIETRLKRLKVPKF